MLIGLTPPASMASMSPMTLTIKVWNCKDGDAIINRTAPRKLLVARGYLPSGQEFITSKVHEGHDPLTQNAAVREITGWLRANRPTWNIVIDGPVVQFTDDGLYGLTKLHEEA